MPVNNVGFENSGAIELRCGGYGSGRPVILVDGHPLSSRAGDKQLPPPLASGRRLIADDFRGGGSATPWGPARTYTDEVNAALRRFLSHPAV